MKRLGLTLIAMVCVVTMGFAAGNHPVKWEGNINVSKLSNYLVLSSEQAGEVSQICDYFTEQMGRASSSRKNQDALLHKAVYGNLKLMKQTLSPEQYSKYVQLINVTLKNKGIELK